MAKYKVTYIDGSSNYDEMTIEADIAFADDNGNLVLSNRDSKVKAIFAKNTWASATQDQE